MDSCKDIYDKLILFDDLSAEEQRGVLSHTEQCTACTKLLDEFQIITTSLQAHQARHRPDEELLTRYSLYLAAPEEPDYDGRKLTTPEINEIREHLAQCDLCRQRVVELQVEYKELEAYVDSADVPAIPLVPGAAGASFGLKASELVKSLADLSAVKKFLTTPRFTPVAVGALVVLFVAIWLSPFFRGNENPYLRLITLQQEQLTFLTRGSAPEQPNKGLVHFYAGDYPKAITDLRDFISKGTGDPFIVYAHYVLGISLLHEARTDFLGRFRGIDSSLVDESLVNLRKARELSPNAAFQADCYWYLAVAHLMKEDTGTAMDYLNRVVSLQDRRSAEAQEMLAAISAIEAAQ